MMKEIEGISLGGEKRQYKFNLMDARTGLEVWHRYGEKLAFSIPAGLSGERDSLVMFAWTIIKSIPFDELLELARKMLAGATIGSAKADEDGLGAWCQGAPDEMYAALIYAALANYEKVLRGLVPFLRKLEEKEDQDDSTSQNTQPSEAERKAD